MPRKCRKNMTPPENSPQEASDTGLFRSLRNPRYRLWAAGFAVSSIGTWMQRIAQDWLVLTQLSHDNASALGTVMALQFLPMLLFLPLTGATADRFDKRKVLFVTQILMSLLSFGLGILTVSGAVQLWHVYTFAFVFGTVVAFDTPTRQSFISEIVTEAELPNAVALNSATFSLARMLGPAIAGFTIAKLGCGFSFIANAISFLAVLVSLCFLKTEKLHSPPQRRKGSGSLLEGIEYVWKNPSLLTVFIMLFLIGTFGINFPIFISTMAVKAFHVGSKEYGVLAGMMGIGAVVGALTTAQRKIASVDTLCFAAGAFGLAFLVGAFMPDYLLFGLSLIVLGVATQTFTATANSNVQLSTVAHMRGRIMSLFSALTMGSTPVGAPIVGFIADKFGPRAALLVGALAGFSALLVGVIFLWNLRAAHRASQVES